MDSEEVVEGKKDEKPKRRKFKVARKEEEFDIELKDGTEKVYLMREMDGTNRSLYMDTLGKRSKFTVGGKSAGLTDYKGLEANLLTKCVFDPETNKLVSAKEVDNWSSTGISQIFDWALEFNGLNKDAEKDAKNDSPPSEERGGE